MSARMVPLLPPHNPQASETIYAGPAAPSHPPTGGSPEHMKAWASMGRYYNYGAHYNSHTPYKPTPYWRRYIAVLESGNKRRFAKVIIQEELSSWAEKNEYKIVRSSQIYGSINPEKEKTEISDR